MISAVAQRISLFLPMVQFVILLLFRLREIMSRMILLLRFAHPHYRDAFISNPLFTDHGMRQPVEEGRAFFVPVFLSDVPRLFESGMQPLDAVFVNATIDDELYEQLEAALLMADTGIPAAAHILQDLRDRVWAASATRPDSAVTTS